MRTICLKSSALRVVETGSRMIRGFITKFVQADIAPPRQLMRRRNDDDERMLVIGHVVKRGVHHSASTAAGGPDAN